MKKRIIALLTAAALLMTLFAAGCSGTENKPEDQGGNGEVIDLTNGGIIFTMPKEYEEAKGLVNVEAGALGDLDDVYYSIVSYFAMGQDEYDRLNSSDAPSDEEIQKYYGSLRQPAVIICAAEGISVEEIADATGIGADTLDKFGSNEGYDYYVWIDSDTSMDAALGDYAAEYRALCDRDLTISCVRFVKPVKETINASNGKLSFETADVNGSKITSDELFAANKVTMVNIFASWCGPCVSEMPELEELNKEFASMGCGIVGILADAYEDTGLEDGKEVIKETGVTYPVILPWDSFENDLYYNAYPTTYFVDSEGNILDIEPIVGAYVSRYKQVMEQALNRVS